MGQPWDNIYYKHKGKGDAICDLIAHHRAELSYDKLNARNEPLIMASTPLWSIPIAYTEDNHIFKAIPMIARKTVLRIHSGDGTTRLRLVRVGDQPPKAKLLVSRKFVETIDETPLEVEVYLEAPPRAAEAWMYNPNELTCEDWLSFQEIIDNGIARGWWPAPPEHFIINDRTLTLAPTTDGYSIDGSWLIGFLLACRDYTDEVYDNLTPQIGWDTISHTPMGRYVTPDQPDKIKAVIHGGGALLSNATISLLHNTQRYGNVMISGLVNGYFTCYPPYSDSTVASLIIHASKPYVHMTGAEREQAISVRFFSSSDLGETFTAGSYTFSRVGSSGWLIYEMVARAGDLFLAKQTLSIALPNPHDGSLGGSYAVDTDIAAMINLDGKACFDPAWYLENTK
jgi:hypothetical protein